MPAHSRRCRWERQGAALGWLISAALLAGCDATLQEARNEGIDVRAAIARGDMHSPRAAAVALTSIDGAPDPVIARFKQAVTKEAASREITITDPSLARYFVRGYLDAYATDGGTAVHYVWDVFDAAKHRTRRLGDDVVIPQNVADTWDAVDDTVLSSLASRSADEMATFLATTPEAAGSPGPVAAALPAPAN